MGEICASGSVGGEGGNALAYPATCVASRRPLLIGGVKGQVTSGSNREGESTDAQRRDADSLVQGSESGTMIRERVVTKIIGACGERRKIGPGTKASFSDQAAD